jgi:hypothetical protein
MQLNLIESKVYCLIIEHNYEGRVSLWLIPTPPVTIPCGRKPFCPPPPTLSISKQAFLISKDLFIKKSNSFYGKAMDIVKNLKL